MFFTERHQKNLPTNIMTQSKSKTLTPNVYGGSALGNTQYLEEQQLLFGFWMLYSKYWKL